MIENDANDWMIGVVLMQDGFPLGFEKSVFMQDGHPIDVESKNLEKVQQNYSNYERALYAII